MTAADALEADGSAPRFRAGDVIGGRYELAACIGVGAMGAVFRAHDRLLDAELAVKLIRVDPDRADAELATHRLLQEARAIARISHPGIVRVFDFGSAGGVPFIVMERLHGESLAHVLARDGRMSAELALRRMLPIADALAVAHRRGVVHRDVKPENVFLARDELGRVRPKLVDFGVARLRENGRGLTRPGALMGTPDYMAPEQARTEPDVDQRADVWSFAVVLYELMTGTRPFAGDQGSYLGVLKAIVSDAPVPTHERGAGDEALWRILSRALEKWREDRFPNLRELGAALAAWLYQRGVTEDAYGGSLRTAWLTDANAPESAPAHAEPPGPEPESSSPGSEAPLETPAPRAMAAPPLLEVPVPLPRPEPEPVAAGAEPLAAGARALAPPWKPSAGTLSSARKWHPPLAIWLLAALLVAVVLALGLARIAG